MAPNRTQYRRPPDLDPDMPTAFVTFVQCMASGARPSRFTFQEPNALDCAAVLADEVRCRVSGDDAACRNVALRHRHAVDPYALPWQPRPVYVTALATQRRLPYQIDTERRTGIRVAVPPVAPAAPPAGGSTGPRGSGGRPPPAPPSSGVAFSVTSSGWWPTERHYREFAFAGSA